MLRSPLSPFRDNRLSRCLRRTAVVAGAIVFAVSLVAVPQGTAGTSLSLRPGSTQSTAPEDVPPLLPNGTITDQQMDEAVQTAINDPVYRAVIEEYAAFYSKYKTYPGNASAEWFDLNALKKIHPGLPKFVLRELRKGPSGFPTIRGKYTALSEEIKGANAIALIKRLGLPSSFKGRLVQISATSIYHDTHSEMLALELLKISILRGIHRLRKSINTATATNMASKFAQKMAIGLANGNSTCAACSKETSFFRDRFAISEYGTTAAQHKTSVGNVSTLLGHAFDVRRVELTAAAREKIIERHGLSPDADLGPEWGVVSKKCSTDAAVRIRPGNVRITTTAMILATAPCGEGKEGAGAPGVLAKTLESSNLGGVDFSTLQMRYMSDDPGSSGLQYSFSGQRADPGVRQNIDSAIDSVKNSADDLRTWLVLSPDKFWVNLNPSEPDRIIDPQMGETDAGKAMLQADLQLKTTSAKIIDPRTMLGAEYWKVLEGSAQQVCYGSRMWIVPGEVQVREDGGSLYILKAKLAVKAVPDHVAAGDSRCHYNAAIDARGERLDDAMVVPRVTKAVNTAPEYAAIRRAFMARIVAQWIRDRHERGQRTSFDKLIDSGNIGPARLQDGWEPRQVFDTYVHQLKSGLFTYKTTTRQGGYIMTQTTTVGGVDFTGLHPTAISAAQMDKQYPRLAQTAAASTRNLTGGADGTMWLGDTIVPPVTKHASAGSNSSPGSSFITVRTGFLILIVAVLGVVAFRVRRSSRRRRRT